jgi:hypothetical protein
MKTRRTRANGRWAVLIINGMLLSAAAAPAVPEASWGPVGFDLSGWTSFLDIADALSAGEEVDADRWDALFATPGYAALVRSEFQPEALKDRFELAFSPSRDHERRQLLAGAPSYRRAVVEHAVDVRRRRAEIEAFLTGALTDELGSRAVALAHAWLPAGAPRRQVVAAVAVFEPDARGSDPVVIDPVAAERMGADLVLLLAHEFHHHFRNDLLEFDRGAVPPGDADLVWILDQLQAEGTADQIDKRPWIEAAGRGEEIPSRALAFVKEVEASPAVIHMLDMGLARLIDPGADAAAIPRDMRRQLPASGHPTGFFMADAILHCLGREALLAEIGDPFRFVELYQEAALRSDGAIPALSRPALAALRGAALRVRTPKPQPEAGPRDG